MKMLANTTPEQNPEALWAHFSATYFSLRVGLAMLAFAFPVVLYGFGHLRYGLDLQPSMSAYFWAATAEQCASFPMRSIFVGFLFAIGVGLYLYKGFTPFENALLNAAGICAALVATYPESISLEEASSDSSLKTLFDSCPAVKAWAAQPDLAVHYVAAVTLFVILAIVAWACAEKTLEFAPESVNTERFRRIYKIIAVTMLLFPVGGVIAAHAVGLGTHGTFFIEAAGISTFGVYWTTKSVELWLSQIEAHPSEASANARRREQQRQVLSAETPNDADSNGR